MIEWITRRYLDLLGSVYIYNEHRGYTAIDRVLEAAQVHARGDTAFIAAIEKHRADERKHYLMFRRWFELRGTMPLLVGRTCGHIDRFVEIMFGKRIDDLDTDAIIGCDSQFEKRCRIISLTEQRGHRQVEILLRHPLVRRDRVLMKIFRIIEKDEPSHWQPYDAWLKANGKRDPKWWERAVDTFIHSELLFLKLPALLSHRGSGGASTGRMPPNRRLAYHQLMTFRGSSMNYSANAHLLVNALGIRLHNLDSLAHPRGSQLNSGSFAFAD